MAVIHWLQDAHRRIYPVRNERGTTTTPLVLDVARRSRVALQAAVSWQGDGQTATVSARCESNPAVPVRVRRVGFVPQRHFSTQVPEAFRDNNGHVPGYVPDPLFDETSGLVPSGETIAFWITLWIAEDTPVGELKVQVILTVEDQDLPPLEATVRVHELVLQERRNFPVVQWFYNDAILDWYGLTAFEEAFWQQVEPYMHNLPEHGQDTIYAPVFTPPLDGVKRPTQLLHVAPTGTDAWSFDWQDVRRYVKLAQRCGIRNFEWTHLFTQWGAGHAIRIYEGQGVDEKLLWAPETGATSDTYRAFLAQFLPAFRHFLEQEKLTDVSFFHVSDEPHGEAHRENYIRARAMLRELAPWMKTMDALSEIEYGRQHLTDMPIPITSKTREYVEEGIPCMTYFCCGPRGKYLQRLLDTPLQNTRMAGWLFYRFGVQGFLHWGYNYWHLCHQRQLADPFTESAGGHWPGWTYGDPFVVYPGPQGPLDSIRWEIFAESLQDYALLQTVGVDRESDLLAELVDFDDFPRTLDWQNHTRRRLLTETDHA